MTFTAFLILEVNLWMKEGSNLVSMAKLTLGRWGQAISWVVYLFLLYSLTTAYIAGSGPIIQGFMYSITGLKWPDWTGALPLLLLFGFFVYKGARLVDHANRLLMIGLILAYVAMIFFLTPHIDHELLSHVNWKYLWVGVSVIATSFGFHIIIPSLTTYLEADVAKLKKVIWMGSAIPLIVYLLWEYLILGIISLEGEHGIIRGYEKGIDCTCLLALIVGDSLIAVMARLFSLFAILTSFLGVSLSLSDCLADGLNIRKTRSGRLLLYGLTFLPPLVFTLTDPRAFLSALEYAGAFGVVVLLGLFPPIMVWSGRYYKKLSSPGSFTVPGGKWALVVPMLFSVVVIAIELTNNLLWIFNK
jgi:tyrosine-specific transport protein